MFVASLAIGVNNNWIDSNVYLPIIEQGWNAICSQTTSQGDVNGICIGKKNSNNIFIRKGTGIMYSDEQYNQRPTATSASVGMGALIYAATAYYQLQNK